MKKRDAVVSAPTEDIYDPERFAKTASNNPETANYSLTVSETSHRWDVKETFREKRG